MEKRRVLFKARGSSSLGFGHISRCLALARTLPADCRPVFVVNDDLDRLDLFRSIDADMIRESQLEKLDAVPRIAATLYDQFDDDPAFFERIRRVWTGKILGLDYQELDAPKVDAVVTLFNHHPEKACPVPVFEGLEYAIVHEKFRPFRQETPRTAVETLSRVAVMMGGADPNGLTVAVLKFLVDCPEKPRVDAIVGPLNPWLEAIDEVAGSAAPRMQVHRNPIDLPKLMARADAAISGCATTFFEFSYLQTPAIVLTQTPMEERFRDHLVFRGLALDGQRDLASAWATLTAPATRLALMARQRATFDGHGAERVLRLAGVF